MKKSIIFSTATIAFAFMLGACNNSSTTSEQTNNENASPSSTLDTTKLKTGETYYRCEMHPEVVSSDSGSCSKCGMYLEKVVKK